MTAYRSHFMLEEVCVSKDVKSVPKWESERELTLRIALAIGQDPNARDGDQFLVSSYERKIKDLS
jgi:hypothetical protein